MYGVIISMYLIQKMAVPVHIKAVLRPSSAVVKHKGN